ncbi:MAG TPA: hypothetical protein VG755_33690 [Nannocystaceae bacterium]|nr:hypothetical protein [Nannocystaceae bacterium]
MRALERDAAWYFVGKACAALGVFAAIPLTTRTLQTSALADYALWSAAALWCSTAAVGWLQTGIQRFHRERRHGDRFGDYLHTVRVALRIGAVVSAIVVGGAAALLSSLQWSAIAAIATLAGTNALYLGFQATTQADLAAKRVVAADVARGLALPLALVVVVACDAASVAMMTAAQALGLLAAVALLAVGSPRSASDARVRLAELRSLARYGLPLGLWLVTTLASAQLGRVALELAGTPDALAAYAAFHDVVVKAGTLVLMPIVYAVHGHVMASWADGDRMAVARSLKRALLLQGAAGLVLVLGFTISAPLMEDVLFGAHPPNAGSTIALVGTLALGVAAANLGLLAHKGLEIGQRTPTMLGLAAFALATNGVLCLVLVPCFGALGAAFAYLVAQLVYAALAHVCSRRTLAELLARSA